MEQNNNDVIEIDLREIFMVLLRKIWLILLVALLLGTSAFLVSNFVITPTYESETRIVVLSKQSNTDTLTYSDLQMGSQLTKDYVELILSRYVIEQVIAEFELDTTYDQFVNKVDVATPSDTRIINITVTDPSAILAKELVDAIRDVAAVRIKEVMDIEAVNLVDEGNVAEEPSNPNVLMWTLVGILLGGCMAAGFVLVRYLLDDTIKSSEDIEKYLQLSTLALIPIGVSEEDSKDEKKGKRKKEPKEPKKMVVTRRDESLTKTDEDEEEDLTELTDLSELTKQPISVEIVR